MSKAIKNKEQLIQAAQAGDKKALEQLIEQEQTRIYRFSMKVCSHPDDAADVLQDTLLAVAKNLPEFRGNASFSTWLYRIARNFCLKKRRKSKFAPDYEESLENEGRSEALALIDKEENPEQIVAGGEIRNALSNAIMKLEPKYREVLVLRDVEGLTATEVGEVLNLSVAAIKSRLHRARAEIRDSVAPLLPHYKEPHAPVDEDCPDVIRFFSKRLEDELSPDICKELQSHVDACTTCMAICDSLKETLSLCQRSPTPEIPKVLQNSIREQIRSILARV